MSHFAPSFIMQRRAREGMAGESGSWGRQAAASSAAKLLQRRQQNQTVLQFDFVEKATFSSFCIISRGLSRVGKGVFSLCYF